MYVIFNSRNESFTIRKLFKIVHFGLYDTPPTLHRSVVKAPADTGHTLDHTRINELLVKNLVCVLNSSVTVEDRFSIGIKSRCLIKGFKNKCIVVAVADLVCNDSSVIKIKNCR